MQGEIKETEKDEEDEDTVGEIDEEDYEDEGEGNYSNGDDEDMIQNDIGPGSDDFRETDGGSGGEETQEGNQMTSTTGLPPRLKKTPPPSSSSSLPLSTSFPFSHSLFSSPFTTVYIDTVLRHDKGMIGDDTIDNDTADNDNTDDGSKDNTEKDKDDPSSRSRDLSPSVLVVVSILFGVLRTFC